MKHELKIKPEYFSAVFFGEKTFEIRNNADRNFQVGDTLLLKAWDGEFTGDFVEKVVSYITDFEQKPGYVVLGLVNHREHELLEKFHRTGVAIERAISWGSVLAGHPLKSHLELLANHHKRELAIADRCQLLALLLREARNPLITAMDASSEDESTAIEDLIERIEAALAGQVKGRTITEGQELELSTVLQSIASGFSEDPVHDAAALLKRITGEVPWTGDSFQIPPRQGGEPCASVPPLSSKA